MPLTKLVFVKLLLSLADDSRFIMDLDDSQKLDYFILLLTAGLTKNDIPIDYVWLKSRFHLQKTPQELQQNVERIMEVFHKIKPVNGKLKFNNFKQLHNYMYSEKESTSGILKELDKNSIVKTDWNKVTYGLMLFYIQKKDFSLDSLDKGSRGRICKRIKELLVKAHGDELEVKRAIAWATTKKWCDWTLETVIKKWADFMKEGKDAFVPDSLKEYLK